MIKRILYMSADPGYDDHELYDLVAVWDLQLVCPVKRYTNIPSDRIKLIEFYKSILDKLSILSEVYQLNH